MLRTTLKRAYQDITQEGTGRKADLKVKDASVPQDNKENALAMKKWTTGEGVTTICKPLKTSKGQDIIGRCLAISSQYVFVQRHPSTDHTIYTFAACTGEYSHQLTGFPHYVDALVVSEDETKAAAHGYEGRVVCVWNAQTGERLRTHRLPDKIESMIMHNHVLAVGLDLEFNIAPSVFLWNLESGRLMRKLDGVKRAFLLAMSAQHIAVYDCQANVVQLWTVKTGDRLFNWKRTSHFREILLDSETKSLVARHWPGDALTIWDTVTGKRRAKVEVDDDKDMESMVIRHGQAVLVCGHNLDSTETVDVVDLRSCTVLKSANVCPDTHGTRAKMVLLFDELGIVPALHNRQVRVWNVSKREYIRTINFGEKDDVREFCASPTMLQLVMKEDNKLIYMKYDFGV